jgi:uncharacterized protein
MKYFLYKLIPPRQTFLQDMTQAEEKLMHEHVKYWENLINRRIAIIFGPVADPKGGYGIAIIETKDENVVNDLGTNDPAIKPNVGFRFEIYSMPEPILRK